MMRRLIRASIAVLISLAAAAGPTAAQTLSVQRDRFAVDGSPRFLVFISYFGAMGADDAMADLHFLKAIGFDGVRILPNWRTGPRLLRSDGSLDPAALSRLESILDRAREERLIVDVTFTAEHTAGLDAERYGEAIGAATDALRGYRNVLFDIQNERNVYGPFFRSLSAGDVGRIVRIVKARDGARVVTASNSGGPPAATADFAQHTGLDVTAYHESRDADWYTADRIRSVVSSLRGNGRPAYLQEPTRVPFPSTDRASYFREAMTNAKLAGAAAWCFHTDLAFDLGGAGARIKQRLHARAEPEWAFVSALRTRIHLRADAGMFVVADEHSGEVLADRQVPGPSGTFTVTVLDGGPPVDDDRITLQSGTGQYLEAVDGGGGAMRAVNTSPGQAFTIDKAGGGPIVTGDRATLRTADGPWYVTAEHGGGDVIVVNRQTAGPWETFTIVIVQ